MRQKFCAQLDLNDQQKKVWEDNWAKQGKAMKELFGSIKEKREALQAEFGKDKLDMKKISAINDDLKKLSAQKLDLKLQCIVEAQKILTGEQFKKFIAMKHEHKGWHFNEGEGMVHHAMFMRHNAGMMGAARSAMVTSPDGGVIVMKGHSLLKYDKNLNLVKEAKIEKIDAAPYGDNEEATQEQEESVKEAQE